MKTLHVLLALAALTASTWSATIHVPQDHPTIQEAIDAATTGDTVLVAAGTYAENINFNGKEITVASHYLVDGDPTHILETVIDGGHSKDPDFASCVLIVSGEGPSAVLQGFTLTNGRGTKWLDIHFKQYYREGGGVLIELSSPTIRNNLIVNNQAVDKKGMVSAGGGGIRAGDGSPLIENNVIMNNRGLYGGGIVLNFATGVLRNNIVYKNSGGEDYGGGGLWTYAGGDTVAENNVIVDNASAKQGGGVLVWSTSLTARNNIIRGNEATGPGDQIHTYIGASCQATYCNIEGGYSGQGNVDLDPLFGPDRFLLSPGSPCIDAGDPDAQYQDPEDPANPGHAGYPSLGLLRNDMGAYGGPARTLFPLFETLKSDEGTLSESAGGTVNFTLTAGIENANRGYLLLGSLTGTEPGVLLPGGFATLPLNWDLFTNLILCFVNTPIFKDFLGTLDGAGTGTAQFNAAGPLPPGTAGTTIHFAFGLSSPWNFVSHPLAIEVVP